MTLRCCSDAILIASMSKVLDEFDVRNIISHIYKIKWGI